MVQATAVLRVVVPSVLSLGFIGWYVRRRWRARVKWGYDCIQLPAIEDYHEKTKSGLIYILGGVALTPQEQIEAFVRMGRPKYFKSRFFCFAYIYSTVKEDLQLNSTKRKAATYMPYRPFLGHHSILFQEGDKARKERGMLNRWFGQQTYRSMLPIMQRASQRLLDRMLHDTKENGDFKVEQLLSRATLEVIAEAGFSFEIDRSENVVYLNALKKMMRIPGNPICLLPHGTKIIAWLNQDAVTKTQELLENTISARIKSRAEGDAGSKEEVRDLLDLVILASRSDGQEVDVAWIRDQVNLLFIGGSDTSSVTLHFAFLLLAVNPEIQTKVKAEVRDVFGRISNDYDRISNLPYVEAFIKEVLRMYPPFLSAGRRLDDGETEFRGYPIKDTYWSNIQYSSLLGHRREEYFPDPDSFLPERWLNGQADAEAFGTFSAGFRSCLGKNFAMIEMKTIISTVLLSNHVVPADPQAKFPHYGFAGQVGCPIGKFDLRLEPDIYA